MSTDIWHRCVGAFARYFRVPYSPSAPVHQECTLAIACFLCRGFCSKNAVFMNFSCTFRINALWTRLSTDRLRRLRFAFFPTCTGLTHAHATFHAVITQVTDWLLMFRITCKGCSRHVRKCLFPDQVEIRVYSICESPNTRLDHCK